MTILKIDDKNEIYYEFVKPKDNGFTFVFVNALTGNVSTWNGEIGQLVVGQGNGYLTYNFRGQETSKFDESLDLDTEIKTLFLTSFLSQKYFTIKGDKLIFFPDSNNF